MFVMLVSIIPIIFIYELGLFCNYNINKAEDLDLNSANSLLTSLISYVEEIRSFFSSIECDAKQLSQCEEYEEEYKRPRKRNRRFEDYDDQTVALTQSPSDRYKTETFFVILIVKCKV